MPIFLKDNHQLESRMQEICQSGSEGGVKRTFVPTPIGLKRTRAPARQPVVRRPSRTVRKSYITAVPYNFS
jgi:hypothetical protein